jgi:hypothetical protein
MDFKDINQTANIKHMQIKSVNTDNAYAVGIIVQVSEIENKQGHKIQKHPQRRYAQKMYHRS